MKKLLKKLREKLKKLVERLQEKFAPHTLKKENPQSTIAPSGMSIPKDSYENAKILLVWANLTGFTQPIYLDGVMVHTGKGQALYYKTNDYGTVYRV